MSIKLFVSILGQESTAPRTQLWCPTVKQPIHILRKVIRARLFPVDKSNKKKSKTDPNLIQNHQQQLRLFFNGQELLDDYTIEDYDLQDTNVIQAKLDLLDPQERILETDYTETAIDPEPLPSQPITPQIDDPFYSPGDHIDALDPETGSWSPARIISIPSPKTYLITYRKPSLGSSIQRTLTQIRPQSVNPIPFVDLYSAQPVLALFERAWYVSVIERTNRDYRHTTKAGGKIWLNLIRPGNQTVLEQHVVKFKEENFLELEGNVPKIERDARMVELISHGSKIKRFYDPDCTSCLDDPHVPSCTSCGCQICTQKTTPESQLICDECDRPTHLWCLARPLETIPKDPEWYCDGCRNETRKEIEQSQRKYLENKRHLVVGNDTITTKRYSNWGYGMTAASGTLGSTTTKGSTAKGSNTKESNTTKPNSCIFGPIDGVPVGSWWRFRAQASESGCHAPLVSGIHGKENLGAYSVIFSGAYPEDVDLGDDLYYSAIGGRDNASPKQSRSSSNLIQDQALTKVNKALALNCAAAFDAQVGSNSGTKWREGKPVRLLRSGNNRKSENSLYCPKIGIRYDGLYKVVKYWSEVLENPKNTRIWRFHLRRDDPAPAPWTECGRYQARKLGYLTPKYPEGWTPDLAGKRKLKTDLQLLERSKKIDSKRAKIVEYEKLVPKIQQKFLIPNNIIELIQLDFLNQKMWNNLLEQAENKNQEDFLTTLQETFTCIICMDPLLLNPVTLPHCGHSFCSKCLERAIHESQLSHCPTCRSSSLDSVILKRDIVSVNGKSKGVSNELNKNLVLEKILKEFNKIK